MNTEARILVAGQDTLIGRAIVDELRREGRSHIVPGLASGVEYADADKVRRLFRDTCPEYVFMCAGQTGGILANVRRPASLMLDNLLCSSHVMACAHEFKAGKLLYLASSCSYPRECPQPMAPESLLTGPLEPTNEAYAVAKLAGMALCRAYRQQHGCRFIVGIPANAFGPGDDFSDGNSHVVGALIRRMHAAKCAGERTVTVWGTGEARRDFIFAGDLASACIHVMRGYDGPVPINLGLDRDVSIADLAAMIQRVVGFKGTIVFDRTKPDGMPRKCLDAAPLRRLGWSAKGDLEEGLRHTYRWFQEKREPVAL